jgi:hypothetical protein
MSLSSYQWAGVVVLIIAIILLVIGIIILALDQSNQKQSEWWVWALIVIGVIGVIIGIALFFIPSPKTMLEEKLESMTGRPLKPSKVACEKPEVEIQMPPDCKQKPEVEIQIDDPCGQNQVPYVPDRIDQPIIPQRETVRKQIMPLTSPIQEGVYCSESNVFCPPGTAYRS